MNIENKKRLLRSLHFGIKARYCMIVSLMKARNGQDGLHIKIPRVEVSTRGIKSVKISY